MAVKRNISPTVYLFDVLAFEASVKGSDVENHHRPDCEENSATKACLPAIRYFERMAMASKKP